MLAQLGNPDMRTPIAFALSPELKRGRFLDLAALGKLNFAAPDHNRFPCLGLAREALRAGGGAPTVLNAANEVAVAAFLDSKLRFDQIPVLIGHVLAEIPVAQLRDLEHVFHVDRRARDCAGTWLARNAAATVRRSLRITA